MSPEPGTLEVKLPLANGKVYVARDGDIPVVCMVVKGRTICVPLRIAGELTGRVNQFVTLTGAGQLIASALPRVAPGQLSNGFGELHNRQGKRGDVASAGSVPQVSGGVGECGRFVEAHQASPSVGAPVGAVCDDANPTVGDPGGDAVPAPSGAASPPPLE